MMISMIQHELPTHKYVPLLTLKREKVEIVELEVSEDSPFAQRTVQSIALPSGVLLTAILRGGEALLARGGEVILPNDHVLCLLEPGKEKELIEVFLPSERPEDVQAETSIDMISE
jgi:Trk K+ transport system NAD-binding subunit